MATHKLNSCMRVTDLEEAVKRMPNDADRADIQFLLDVIKEKDDEILQLSRFELAFNNSTHR